MSQIRLDAISANEKQADIALYQSIVGSPILMWAALGTRPHIAYAVATLSRYTTKTYTTHMTAAKRVLQYLKGTSQAKMHFPSRGSESTSAIAGYTDSDWANDRGDRKSQGGYVFHARFRGNPRSRSISPYPPPKPNISLARRLLGSLGGSRSSIKMLPANLRIQYRYSRIRTVHCRTFEPESLVLNPSISTFSSTTVESFRIPEWFSFPTFPYTRILRI